MMRDELFRIVSEKIPKKAFNFLKEMSCSENKRNISEKRKLNFLKDIINSEKEK